MIQGSQFSKNISLEATCIRFKVSFKDRGVSEQRVSPNLLIKIVSICIGFLTEDSLMWNTVSIYKCLHLTHKKFDIF